MSRTTVVLTEDLQEQAKEYRVNISEVCRHAVGEAIKARKEARRLDDDFEQVYAWKEDDFEERVAFFGKFVYEQDGGRGSGRYYVTPGGRVACVDDDGLLVVFELEEIGFEGPAYQAAARALGEVPEPTFLDI